MRIAHVSDLHLTDGPDLADQIRMLGEIAGQIEQFGCDAVLLTGDFYGHTVPHRSTPQERLALFPFVARLAAGRPVVVLYGNHDYPGDLEPLGELGGELGWGVKVVSRAEAFSVQTPAGELHVLGMPYPNKRWLLAGETVRGIEETRKAVTDKLSLLLRLWGRKVERWRAESEAPVVFIGHATVTGCKVSGGEVLAGQEIELSRHELGDLGVDYAGLGHIHLRQELAPRIWYVGSTWRNSFAEREDKGWSLVDIGVWLEPEPVCKIDDFVEPVAYSSTDYEARGSQHQCRVLQMLTTARERVTLDYRWAPTGDDEEPGWATYPRVDRREDIRDADIRTRFVVPQQWATSMPWEEEVTALLGLGAWRVKVERVVEPVLRVRAPKVAEAETIEGKLQAYWPTLATAVDPAEQDAAMTVLAELQIEDDDSIQERNHAILSEAG